MNSPHSSRSGSVDDREKVSLPTSSSTSESVSVTVESGNNNGPLVNQNGGPWNGELRQGPCVRNPRLGVPAKEFCKSYVCINPYIKEGGSGLSSLQNSSFPPLIQQHQQQQQQIAMSMRAVPHHHHHHHHHPTAAPSAPCHPHQAPSSFGPFPNLHDPNSHSQVDRMMHNSSSGQQMRSVVHYAGPPPGCMQQQQQNGHPNQNGGGGYFSLSSGSNNSTAAPGGGSSFPEYAHHPNHHHHHGHGPPGMSSSGSSYRTIAAAAANHHHHSKVVNAAHQAATLAAYQNVYHQYSQYIHQQGIMHSLQNHQQNSNSDYPWNHNMIGLHVNAGQSMQMRNQPHAHMLPFMNNRVGSSHLAQSMPQFQQHHHHHHHNHGFHSGMVQSCVATGQQLQPPLNRLDGLPQLQSLNGQDAGKNEDKSESSLDLRSTLSKESFKVIHKEKSKRSSSILKSGSGKICSSLEKSSKAKTTKSVTRIRDRPRLAVGQKKKSTISCTGRKHRSSKAGNLISEILTGKRIAGSTSDSRGLKRSKKLTTEKESDDDILETASASSTSTSEKSDDCDQCKNGEGVVETKAELYDGYYLNEGLEEDEYVPSPEELINYLEQLNELNAMQNLDIPTHQPCPLYPEEEDSEGDKESSDCSIDEILEEAKCLNCLTWQQQHYDISPTRPPPGFEHLARPSFPIELYDPTLLGSIIGSQVPRGPVQIGMPRTYLEEIQEVLINCCEKHTIDKLWTMKKKVKEAELSIKHPTPDSKAAAAAHSGSSGDDADDCEWESLNKAIQEVLDDWTEELYFRKKVQQILFGLNLGDDVLYGGCCKASAAASNVNGINFSSGKETSCGFAPLISREQQSQSRYFIDDSNSL